MRKIVVVSDRVSDLASDAMIAAIQWRSGS